MSESAPAVHITRSDIDNIGAVQKLKPTESDFKGKKGYRSWLDKHGKRQWAYDFKPNDAGKPTKAGLEVQEMLKPFQRADAERHSRLQGKIEREMLRDGDGGRQYVEPHLARATAQKNGWHHAFNYRPTPIERGPDGMLWRATRGGWEPMGVRCLGTPLVGSRTVPCRGRQRDPEGAPWGYIRGQWRCLVPGSGELPGDEAAHSRQVASGPAMNRTPS